MLRRITGIILALSLALCFCCSVFAAEPTNVTLDFSDSATISQWGGPDLWGQTGATKEIKDGELQLGSTLNWTESGAVYKEAQYSDFTIEFTYRFIAGANNDGVMLLYRADEAIGTGYAVYFVHCPDEHRQYYIKFTSRPYTEIKNGMFYNDNGNGVNYDEAIQVKMVVEGGTHTLYMTKPGQDYGEPVFTHTEETPLYSNGYLGFMQWHDAGDHQVTSAIDNVKITVPGADIEPPVDDTPSDDNPTTGDYGFVAMSVAMLTATAAIGALVANKKKYGA